MVHAVTGTVMFDFTDANEKYKVNLD